MCDYTPENPINIPNTKCEIIRGQGEYLLLWNHCTIIRHTKSKNKPK